MTEFEIWVYRLVIVALGIVIWWVIQWAVKRVTSKLDELIESITELTSTSKLQQEQITNISKLISDQNGRLNDHGKRLRNLELKRAECKNCKQ